MKKARHPQGALFFVAKNGYLGKAPGHEADELLVGSDPRPPPVAGAGRGSDCSGRKAEEKAQ